MGLGAADRANGTAGALAATEVVLQQAVSAIASGCSMQTPHKPSASATSVAPSATSGDRTSRVRKPSQKAREAEESNRIASERMQAKAASKAAADKPRDLLEKMAPRVAPSAALFQQAADTLSPATASCQMAVGRVKIWCALAMLLLATVYGQGGTSNADDPAAPAGAAHWMQPICEQGGGWRRASVLDSQRSRSDPALFTVIDPGTFFRAAA